MHGSELASIKDRIGVIDADMKNRPDLMKIEFRLVESRLARVLQDLQDFRSHVDQRFDAAVRAIAEMLKERR
jgi:hypothetical protein